MTTLAIDRLITSFSQPISVSRDIDLKAMRVKLYGHNNPTGTFFLSIKSGATTILSNSFTSQDLKSKINATEPYYWGEFAFPVSIVLLRGDYTIELSSSGYTFQESSFIGWAKDYDSEPQNALEFLEDFSKYPFSFTLIESVNREVIK